MKNTFINLIKPGAIKAYHSIGVLPSLTIAQAILETGWGKSSIGNNIFGIKANSTWTGKTKKAPTHEYVNGKKIYVNAIFRDYNTIEESIEDRSKFLSSLRYKKVIDAKDYREAALEIFKAGYATDPTYSQKLITIIEQNNLQLIDNEVKKGVGNIMTEQNKPNQNTPSTWAKEAWDWAIKNKLVDGTNPKSIISREQVVTVLHRYTKMVK